MLTDEPLTPEEAYMEPRHGRNVAPAPWTPFVHKPKNLYNTGQAICGGRGCLRACMIGLEARGVLGNKFHSKFRRRKAWSVDWSQPAAAARAAQAPKGSDAD
jgi:hypothetical protein